MGREEFCITCRAADPDCNIHYYNTMITAWDATTVAAYEPEIDKCSVFIPSKHRWAYGVDAKTLYKALEQWRKIND